MEEEEWETVTSYDVLEILRRKIREHSEHILGKLFLTLWLWCDYQFIYQYYVNPIYQYTQKTCSVGYIIYLLLIKFKHFGKENWKKFFQTYNVKHIGKKNIELTTMENKNGLNAIDLFILHYL